MLCLENNPNVTRPGPTFVFNLDNPERDLISLEFKEVHIYEDDSVKGKCLIINKVQNHRVFCNIAHKDGMNSTSLTINTY